MTNSIKKILYLLSAVLLVSTVFFALNNEKHQFSYSPSLISKIEDEFLGPPWQPQPNDYTSYQYNLELIDVIRAWDIETGKENITVAIIDSGIDTDHDEFVGRISELSYNAYSEQVGIEYIEDDLGHGTNVAGIIAAARNNNLGIDGITDNVQLMIIKVNQPGEDVYVNSAIVRGIYYAVDNGADVINLSLGSSTPSSSIKAAVEYAHENEVFVVAAAGNDGTNEPFYPAAFDTVISVGAIDSSSTIASFSNYGSTIDLVAPGVSIYTTNLSNNYTVKSGTSFAAPHIAGVLALILSSGDVSYAEILERIIFTSSDLGEEGKDDYYGNGLINAYYSLITDLIKIDFESNGGETFDSIWIEYNTNYQIDNQPAKEHYVFDKWYLDELLTLELPQIYLFTQDTVLYAGYIEKYYLVTLINENEIYEEIEVMSGLIISDLPILEKENSIFVGWYYDSEFENKYNNEIITENITLFARFENFLYIITFLDADGNVLTELFINSEADLVLPDPPEKNSDTLFMYEFISWSDDLVDIDSNLILYPIYKKTLFFENALLHPGIDTLYLNESWLDSGLWLSDESLYYVVSGTYDTSIIGQYEIIYYIYHDEEIVLTLSRVLNVISKPVLVEITINESVTTIVKGNDYIEDGATSNYGMVDIIGSVNTDEVGLYIITYRIEYEDKVYEKSKYVYVIENDFSPSNDIIWFFKEGEDDE